MSTLLLERRKDRDIYLVLNAVLRQFFTMLFINKPILLPVDTGFFPGPSRIRPFISTKTWYPLMIENLDILDESMVIL